MTSSLPQARGIACGLAFTFVLIGFGARSIAANEPSVTPTTDEAVARAAVQRPAITVAPERPLVVALAEPAPPVIPPESPVAPSERSDAWPAPARFFTINEVLAKRKRAASKSPSVQLAAVDPAGAALDVPATTTPPVRSNEPFGLFTFRAPEGQLWTKWRKVEADIQAEAPALTRCRVAPDRCTPAEARFVDIVKQAEAYQGRERLELVNRRINAAIRYTNDIAQWGAPDIWSAPLDRHKKGSLDTGLGDCEDYAIAKYVALRQAGVAAGDLRLLLVRDNAIRMAHAVLAAHQDGHWLILDNRWTRLIEDTELKQFMPLFALGEHGVKLFAAPYAANRPRAGHDLAMNESEQFIPVGTDTPAADRALATGGKGTGSLPLLL